MSSGPSRPSAHDLRYMIAGEGEQGPKLSRKDKSEMAAVENSSVRKNIKGKPHAKAKKAVSAPISSSGKIALGNFEKMITATLRKSPERLLEDGEFSKIVKKGTQEIIQALHKTNDRQVMKLRVEQFARCETMMKQLDDKFTALINSMSPRDRKRRHEINQIAEIVKALLLQLKGEAAFVDTVKKSFVAVQAPLPNSSNERGEPAGVPLDIIGMMASFLPEKEAEAALDPLLDQFAKKSERAAAKLVASKEAGKGEKLAKEISAQIREALKTEGENFVFPEELKKKTKEVTSLDLSNLGVPLSAKALRAIVTNWPHITNLNLKSNYLTQEVVDLLKELKDLRHLNLAKTNMNDSMFTAVAQCATLQSLDCSWCGRITSLEPLESCPLLQSLNCRMCRKITSLEPLESCPLLQSLDCSRCQEITSLEPLESCPLLQSLDCSGCIGITSLEPLESCSLLQSLDCSNCIEITSLEPLESCPLLQSLDCSYCIGITSLEPLEYCPLLQSLNCSNCNAITDLKPLESCPLLQSLNCKWCEEITSLEPLEYCPSLQSLDCGGCKEITSLEPLESCPLLQSLNCIECLKITSLEPLEYCPSLQSLDCGGCKEITSLEPLEYCPLLQSLNCIKCLKITSLEPLESCPLLQSLFCSGCPITSLEPLGSCPLLQSLVCSGCPITSLEPLRSCPLLQSLVCWYSRTSAEKKAALQQVLPTLRIESE